jgi:biotin operon repressor/DNA-binding Lrp family transcriptional regulator
VSHPNNRPDVATEDVVRLYLDEGMSADKVAHQLGCSRQTVINRLESAGVPRRSRGVKAPKRPDVTEEEVVRLYVNEGMTGVGIGTMLRCSPTTVSIHLKNAGVSIRPGPYVERVDVSSEDVAPLYLDAGMTLRQISEKLGCSQEVVRRRLLDAGMALRKKYYKEGRRITPDGYAMVPAPDDYPRDKVHNGRVLEHRLVMEQYLGRYLEGDENVHHKNGIKDDNRIENLELWTTSQPSGQRVEDKLAWAREFLERYASEEGVLAQHLAAARVRRTV